MAYRKTSRASTRRRGSARRTRGPARRRAPARRSSQRRASAGVLRLEIVQAPANPIARAATVQSEPKAPRRAMF